MIKQWNYHELPGNPALRQIHMDDWAIVIVTKTSKDHAPSGISGFHSRYPHRFPERCPALVHGGAFFCWDAADEYARSEALHIDPGKLASWVQPS